MDTASSFTMADSPIRHKRARVSRACDQCRRKKIRCDADKSTPCTNCRTYGFGCSFLDSAKKRGPPKGYIEALENRLKRMEGLLGGLVDGVDKGTRPKKNSNRDVEDERRRRRRGDEEEEEEEGGDDDEEEEEEEDAEEDDDDEDDNDSASSSHSSRGRVHDYRRQRRRNEASSTNKVPPLTGVEFGKYQHLNALTSPPQTPEEVVDDLNESLEKLGMEDYTQTRYVGSSSGLQLLTPQFEQKDGIFKLPQMKKSPSLPDIAQDVQIKKEPGCGDADADEDLEPVQENLKRRLIDIYFAKVHVIYPIINKLHFLKQFHGDLTTRPHQSLTFAMLALASKFLPEDEPEGKPETLGQMFFERARDSLDQIYMLPRISTVQALVLLALYQNSVAEAHRHWLDCGLAIRMAQELGLHRSNPKWKIPRSEIEARKRLWWTCFIMDRWFGATYGRPLVISEDDCDVDYPSIYEDDDDDISTPLSHSDDSFSPEPLMRSSPPVKKPTYKPFLEIVKISVILGRVLQAFYTPKARKRRSANEKIVKGLDDELAAWSAALPHDLQWQKDDIHNVVSSPIIGSINLCYYTIVILIHRPHIPSNKSSGLRSIYPLRTCTSAATNITKIAQYMNVNNYFDMTWPFSVYNLFQSSLIHMYNNMSSNQETTRTASSALASNIQVLDDLKQSSFAAYKLSLLLGAMSKKEVDFDEPSDGGFWVKVNSSPSDSVSSGALTPKQSSKTLSTRSSYPSYSPASAGITSPVIDHRQHNRYSTSNTNTTMTTNADVSIPLPVPPHVLSHTSLPMSSPSSNLVTLQPEPAFSLRPFAFGSQPDFQRPATQPASEDNMSFALDANGGNGELPNEYFRVDQSNPFYAMPSTYNVEDWDVWMVEHGSTGTMNAG